jgi:hypothetical protein
MKKLLLLALACLWLVVPPGPAQATVSCSVPFNLTNGTTADATQVMANYNAILSCLSTSAASSGSNSDITALLGLTTPITPAQGGAQARCGASGFKVVNDGGTPTTKLDITYTQAVVTSSLNAVQFGSSGSLVLNFGTTGANGLDTGSLTASTFYYLYLIGNGSVIASLGSLSSSAPTLPSGYTYSCRVGVWETGTGSLLLTMQTNGRRTALMQKSNLNIAANALQTTTSTGTCGGGSAFGLTTFAGLPPTAVRVFGVAGFGANNGETYVSSFQNNLDNNSFAPGNESGVASTTTSAYFDLILPSSQQFYTCISATGTIILGGWEDAVNAN